MTDSPSQSEHGDRTLSERLDRMDAAIGGVKPVHVISDDYTIAPSDSGKIVEVVSDSDVTILAPASGAGFEVGAVIEIVNITAPDVYLYVADGGTWRAVAGDWLTNPADVAILRYAGDDEWILTGADLRWD